MTGYVLSASLNKTFPSFLYIDDILRPTAPSFLQKQPRGVINQHHNARPPHSQNRTKPLRSLHRQRVAVARMLATRPK